MKYFSMFSGIGGFELGIRQAYENKKNRQQEPIRQRSVRRSGQRQRDISSIRSRGRKSDKEEGHRLEQWLCCGYSEINKYAIQIYEKHFNHKNYGDITKIKAEELPDFELLCGGFPCQSFSIAGKRMGFSDTRGTLFFEIARIAREKQPRLLLLENVKGLLSHDKGITFYTIISTLDELGYDLQWQVLNSKNFGVPQNRERVFIVGHLRGTSRPEVFPIGQGYKVDDKIQSDQDRKEARASCLSTRYGQRWTDETYIRQGLKELTKDSSQGYRVYDTEGVSTTLAGEAGGVGAKTGLYLEESGEPLPIKIRRLTPTECERLQGFPDGWTEGVSDTQRYKTLGNAVTVNVVKEIVKNLVCG